MTSFHTPLVRHRYLLHAVLKWSFTSTSLVVPGECRSVEESNGLGSLSVAVEPMKSVPAVLTCQNLEVNFMIWGQV